MSLLTPRMTPREAEMKEFTVFIINKTGVLDDAVDADGCSTLGFTLANATVEKVDENGTAASYSGYSVRVGDIITSIGGVTFESARPLHTYLNDKKRATICCVQRSVVPARFPMSARVANCMMNAMVNLPELPKTEEGMEYVLDQLSFMRSGSAMSGTSMSFAGAVGLGAGMGFGGFPSFRG